MERANLESHSLLFPQGLVMDFSSLEPPCFHDLLLDQVIETIVKGREDYQLTPFFYTPVPLVETVEYRHAVFRDVANSSLRPTLDRFTTRIRGVRELREQAQAMYDLRQKQALLLESIYNYIGTVESLVAELAGTDIFSSGLQQFFQYALQYVSSEEFREMTGETKRLRSDLASFRYRLSIHGLSVTVGPYEDEADYCQEVSETFARFRVDTKTDYTVKMANALEMNHVESRILELVARQNPEIFSRLSNYYDQYQLGFLAAPIAQFDRELQFYLSVQDFENQLALQGLSWTFPQIQTGPKDLMGEDAFDIALAAKITTHGQIPVRNDFWLRGEERIIVVSGPNQGGKTTFSRMIGQMHYLARLGCPVPGTNARLWFWDRLLTHFEREEKVNDTQGKLGDDLYRVHGILQRATDRTLIILNEIFSSTTFDDALWLGEKVIEKILEKDAIAIVVTFIDEWATLNDRMVSMVSSVDPHDPTVRTFKIHRQPPDGRAYARTLAQKYGVTYAAIKERIGPL